VQEDPLLLEVAARFLGGDPAAIETRLWWSFVTDASLDDRQAVSQTVYYHYDHHGYRFIYFNFYIMAVGPGAGPHVMIPGSHKRKPLAFLLSSTKQTDQAIERYYGVNSSMTIEGPAGLGFVQDTSCFHKATPPTTSDRLLLQIRMG